MEIKDVVNALKKKVKGIVTIVLVFTFCGAFISYFIPTTYVAKTDLLINSTPSTTGNVNSAVSEIEINLRLIETYKQILKSDRVVSQVNSVLDNLYSKYDLASGIKIDADNGSQIISITATENSEETAANLVNTYAKVFQEEIKTLMGLENITILKDVTPGIDTRQIEPPKFIFIICAFMIGVMISISVIILKEVYFPFLDSKYKVENTLKVPFLGSIFSQKGFREKIKAQRVSNNSFSAIHFPRAVKEDFSKLAANIHYLVKEKDVKTIMLASQHNGEGKTFVGSNLAVKLAMNGQRTLFIDANLRKSDGRLLFDLPERKGLTSIISGFYTPEEIIQETKTENLSFIGTGPLPPNPAQLLQSETMDVILEKFKKSFDVIIIDTSALTTSDAVSLLPVTDGCIYIADSVKTKEDKAEQSLALLKELGGDILGVVLNGKKTENTRMA